MHKQTAKLVARIAENLPDMSEDLMQGWIDNPKSIQKVLRDGFCSPLSESTFLLTPLDPVIIVPASAEPFIARDHFKVGTTSKAELPISYLGDTFREKFLAKVEEPMTETKLRPHRLQRSKADGPIIEALGGDDKAETTMREMHHFLKSADRTKWCLFYIKDTEDGLWAANAGWGGGGWDLDAFQVDYPVRWDVGLLVVARD